MLPNVKSASRPVHSVDFAQEKDIVQPVLGFTAIRQNTTDTFDAAVSAQDCALAHFPDIKQASIQIGATQLFLWGRVKPQDGLYRMRDGGFLWVVGSPVGLANWKCIVTGLDRIHKLADYRPPWNGRYILFHITADGNHWTMWNDWIGSIPIYHYMAPEKTIASTLEPVVVAEAGINSDDFFMPGILSLLIHGNYISDWTLFKNMKVVRPDTVSIWRDQEYSSDILKTITPSEANWDKGWNDLREQMYELSKQAVGEVLQTHPVSILPLSGGLDSRLIAALGIDTQTELSAFTWGSRNSLDAIYAKSVANTLGIPWQFIGNNTNYLKKYTNTWVDLFGSAMHFHGMYQMPFLDSLDSKKASGPILSGFIGECLAGYDVQFQCRLHEKGELVYQANPDAYIHWSVNDVQKLLKFPTNEALETLRLEIKKEIDILDGPWFQRLRFLTLWGRQHYFTYFQSMLSDYWRGVATPFLNRDYAQFCLSLPRAALDGRRLQRDMFSYYLGSAARIPVSYYKKPLIFNGQFFLKRKLASMLPKSVLFGPLQEFNPSLMSLDGACVQNGGRETLWPLYEVWNDLQSWLDMELLENAVNKARERDVRALKKLQSVQAFAYRLM